MSGSIVRITLPGGSAQPGPSQNGFRPLSPGVPDRVIAFDANVARRLVEAARDAADMAHAPYSEFQVGAAVIMADDDDQRIFTGTNLENGAYGSSLCAERAAIAAAVSAGFREIAMIAVSCVEVLDEPPSARSPCGACRQVINEFALLDGEDRTVVLLDRSGDIDVIDVPGLLPYGFIL